MNVKFKPRNQEDGVPDAPTQKNPILSALPPDGQGRSGGRGPCSPQEGLAALLSSPEAARLPVPKCKTSLGAAQQDWAVLQQDPGRVGNRGRFWTTQEQGPAPPTGLGAGKKARTKHGEIGLGQRPVPTVGISASLRPLESLQKPPAQMGLEATNPLCSKQNGGSASPLPPKILGGWGDETHLSLQPGRAVHPPTLLEAARRRDGAAGREGRVLHSPAGHGAVLRDLAGQLLLRFEVQKRVIRSLRT